MLSIKLVPIFANVKLQNCQRHYCKVKKSLSRGIIATCVLYNILLSTYFYFKLMTDICLGFIFVFEAIYILLLYLCNRDVQTCLSFLLLLFFFLSRYCIDSKDVIIVVLCIQIIRKIYFILLSITL